MHIDEGLLYKFETGLDPQNLKDSTIPATVLGFGEISTIFQIGQDRGVAYKRMPLFSDRSSALRYADQYKEYCRLLIESGLTLPEHETAIIEPPGSPVVFYIAQIRLPAERFGHKVISVLGQKDIQRLIGHVVAEIAKIWSFNSSRRPSLELALDGQLSNWVWLEEEKDPQMYYIDTSTPLYRRDGEEQLDPELFLKSAPSFVRWIIRLLFLKDVMNRYYDQRQVHIDLAANLYKEQRPDLVPLAVDIINQQPSYDSMPLTVREVEKYYREDRLIWALFLSLRRFDCWLKTKVLQKRYEFILPGKIKR